MWTVGLFAVSIGTCIAVFNWSMFRTGKRRITVFGAQKTTNPFAPALIALVAGGYLAYRAIQLEVWRIDYQQGRYELVDGCVKDFKEMVERDHDLGTDTFRVNERRFILSDSGWRLGYHKSWHRGSTIQPNAHVRLAAENGQLLRIDIYKGGCPAA